MNDAGLVTTADPDAVCTLDEITGATTIPGGLKADTGSALTQFPAQHCTVFDPTEITDQQIVVDPGDDLALARTAPVTGFSLSMARAPSWRERLAAMMRTWIGCACGWNRFTPWAMCPRVRHRHQTRRGRARRWPLQARVLDLAGEACAIRYFICYSTRRA
jgi:hypothetical protein